MVVSPTSFSNHKIMFIEFNYILFDHMHTAMVGKWSLAEVTLQSTSQYIFHLVLISSNIASKRFQTSKSWYT